MPPPGECDIYSPRDPWHKGNPYSRRRSRALRVIRTSRIEIPTCTFRRGNTAHAHDHEQTVVPPQSPLDQPRAPRAQALRARRLILPITLFVVAGVPLVAYVWDSLNLFFAGRFEVMRLILATGALAVLVALLMVLARVVTRWEETRVE